MNHQSIYDKNEIVLNEDHAEIILKNKMCEEVGRAIIDAEDVEKCSMYKWHMRKGHGNTDYAIASLPENKKIHLHRLVIGYDGNDDVDHINLNGLDNRKCNLRVVSHKENAANNKRTGVKRVPSGRYQASCCRDYKTLYIGTYDTYDKAVQARKQFISQLV